MTIREIVHWGTKDICMDKSESPEPDSIHEFIKDYYAKRDRGEYSEYSTQNETEESEWVCPHNADEPNKSESNSHKFKLDFATLIIILIAILLVGCVKTEKPSLGDKYSLMDENNYKEYVFFETKVLDTSLGGGGHGMISVTIYNADIAFRNKIFTIETGRLIEGTDPYNWSSVYHPSGFIAYTGQKIFVEGIYEQGYLYLLNSFNQTEMTRPSKRYIYANVSILGYNKTNSTIDCSKEEYSSTCYWTKWNEEYNYTFSFRNKSYVLNNQKYDVCNYFADTYPNGEYVDELDKAKEQKIRPFSVMNYTLTDSYEGYHYSVIYFLVPHSVEPKIGESIIVEGLYDETNNNLDTYFALINGKIFSPNGNQFLMNSLEVGYSLEGGFNSGDICDGGVIPLQKPILPDYLINS